MKAQWARYYVDNVFEGLSQPGDWYLDRPTGQLYYIPMPGEQIRTTTIIAPRTEQLLKLIGDPAQAKFVEFIQFKDLAFENADWSQPRGGGEKFERPGTDYGAAPQAACNVPGTIYLKGARFCAIEDCRIAHVGLYGVELAEGCTGNRIVGNEITDLGAGGVKINGADAKGPVHDRTGNNRITDNEISAGGRIFHAAVGVLCMHSFGNRISHNHIHDLYYTGVSCGWVWGYSESVSRDNRIEKNHIHDLGHGLLSDMGGIYTLGVQPGTVIRGNVIHDIEKANYGGWCIYPDEGTSHILIENNICYDTNAQTFHQHYGRENLVRNNIFAFGGESQVALSKIEAHNSFTLERNIIISQGPPMFVGGYAAAAGRGMISDLNLFWDISTRPHHGPHPRQGPQVDLLVPVARPRPGSPLAHRRSQVPQPQEAGLHPRARLPRAGHGFPPHRRERSGSPSQSQARLIAIFRFVPSPASGVRTTVQDS